MQLKEIKDIFYGPEPVRWCSELCRESKLFDIAIRDIHPKKIEEIVEEVETKEEFRDAILEEFK